MVRVVLMSAESKVYRLAYDLDGVKERSNGGKAYRKAAINRAKAVEGRNGHIYKC